MDKIYEAYTNVINEVKVVLVKGINDDPSNSFTYNKPILWVLHQSANSHSMDNGGLVRIRVQGRPWDPNIMTWKEARRKYKNYTFENVYNTDSKGGTGYGADPSSSHYNKDLRMEFKGKLPKDPWGSKK